jgi:mono/diheme cytochrome c family protein
MAPSATGTLPCDVQSFLTERCQGCHGSQLANGAPMHLMTYGDLVAKNEDGILIAQRALARIQNTSAQMPPLPQPSATPAQIAMFGAWITANLPSGECAPVKGPFDGPTVCTSGTRWDRGDDGSQLMHPGRACITCHTNSRDNDAPQLTIGGTVFPTGHEPNDCNGASTATGTTGAVVEVTDAGGGVITLPVNSAGNFLTTMAITFPIHVAVVANGKRRSMGASPPRGDCNSCHTQDGANGAPGRIAVP